MPHSRDAGRPRRRILFLVTEDWYFCSHRLALARAAAAAGFDVTVVTRVDRHGEAIAREGFTLVPLDWRRRSRNPWREVRALARLIGIYRRVRPDLAHHVALKPILYGGVAARLARTPQTVNAVTGFGFLLSSRRAGARALRPLVRWILRASMNRPGAAVVVQNPDDLETLARTRVVDRERMVLVRGSGVDVRALRPLPEPPPPVRAAIVSRMLWSKGVGELVDAARRLRERDAGVEVVLVGDTDPDNPESVPEARLRRWRDEGVVEWWGRVDDVAGVWSRCHVAVLPSHREGMPKSLLEAAACGRPIVTTDVPGCRDVVGNGEAGLLVPLGDVDALAAALERLAREPGTRARLGERARARAEERFAEEVVVAETTALYRRMLDGSGGSA